jgi:flagellar hook-length control protein FliK
MEGAESMKDGLMNEFDLSEEELQAGISNAKDNFRQMLEEGLEGTVSEEDQAVAPLDPNANAVKDTKTDAPQSEAFTDQPMVEEKKVEITTNSSKEGGNKNSLQSGAESSNLFNQVMNNIADAAAGVEGSDMVSYADREQMENIIRQITEKITISAKNEETSMELSLHPASLGNVNILLTSGKDGIVAKFTAQNQIVKEAVEAQMVQLQQKFDEQGIKVTSIEVTIASHGFEQNLEQGNERHSGEAEAEKKVKSLRRINLSDLEANEEAEAQSDAEKIALQMMAANGNMVDFSA